ncbi:hypothetical protein ABBQ32_014007 [Trebouxia sp. C0010 RCD-2024]
MGMVVGVVVVEATEVEVGVVVDMTEGAVEMTEGVVVMTVAVIDMHQIVAGVLTTSREDGAGALHMIVAVQEAVAPAAESWSSKMTVVAAFTNHQHRGASSCLPAGFPVRSSACCKSPLVTMIVILRSSPLPASADRHTFQQVYLVPFFPTYWTSLLFCCWDFASCFFSKAPSCFGLHASPSEASTYLSSQDLPGRSSPHLSWLWLLH